MYSKFHEQQLEELVSQQIIKSHYLLKQSGQRSYKTWREDRPAVIQVWSNSRTTSSNATFPIPKIWSLGKRMK